MFSGTLKDLVGKPPTGPVDLHFSIYKEQADAAPLWQETQTLQLDEQGHYTVLLGGMQPNGLPLELFTTGEARWLGVAAGNLPEQPRTLLVSVPYALKANDAEMLGGKPASAYMLAPPAETTTSGGETSSGGAPAGAPAGPASQNLKPGKSGASPKPYATPIATNYIPVFTNNSGALGSSVMYQSGSNIGVGTLTPLAALDVNGKARVAYTGFGGLTLTGSLQSSFVLTNAAGAGGFNVGRSLSSDNGQNFFLFDRAAGATRLFLDASGNLGIGTTAPVATLHVNGKALVSYTGFAGLTLTGSQQSSVVLTNAAGGAGFNLGRSLGSDNSQNFFIYDRAAAATRLFIGSSGNVGIGKTGPTAKLDVAGNINATSYNAALVLQPSVVDSTAGVAYVSANVLTGYMGVPGGNGITPGVVGATIGGGGGIVNTLAEANIVTDHWGTVAGGLNNQAGNNSGTVYDVLGATVGGGGTNKATASYATVAGGSINEASSDNATVGGGTFNTASGGDCTVAGGGNNTASNTWATVPGGSHNTAAGNTSFAAGSYAKAMHDGAFVWADYGVLNFSSTANDQFLIRASGGVGILPSTPSGPLPAQLTVSSSGSYALPQVQINQGNSGDYARARLSTTGTTNIWDVAAYNGAGSRVLSFWAGASTGGGSNIMSLKPDDATNLLTMSNGARLTAGGAWTDNSDRNTKEHFLPVDSAGLLARLAAMPISTWNYRAEPNSVRHMGPMAQDFAAAFGLGDSNKSISTVDADGVALAAIQALHRLSLKKDAEIEKHRAQIRVLTKEVGELRGRETKLTRQVQELARVQRQMASLQARLAQLEARTANTRPKRSPARAGVKRATPTTPAGRPLALAKVQF